MSYTVFKNNNKSITAPNETGEIILDNSIPRQIRIEVDHNSYKFYDIIGKKTLDLVEIKEINPRMCHFTAIIDPCSDTGLAANKVNYPILYTFANECLGSDLSSSHISTFNGSYYSTNIISTIDSDLPVIETISIEFEFHLGVKIRLNLSPTGLNSASTFTLIPTDVEIISLFQHNITIEASCAISGSTNTKYLFSLSFSFINNRYEKYNKSGLTTKNQVLSMIRDMPQNKKYPASGLIYGGRYSNGASTMSISVYTIKNFYSTGSSLTVNTLLTDKESASTSNVVIDTIAQSITPSLMNTLSFADDVITLS